MALTIRLRRQGKLGRPSYRLVVVDERIKRDGKYLEMLGWYNPMESKPELSLSVDPARVEFWVGQGALLSDNARILVGKVAPAVLKNMQVKVASRRNKARLKAKERRKKLAASA